MIELTQSEIYALKLKPHWDDNFKFVGEPSFDHACIVPTVDKNGYLYDAWLVNDGLLRRPDLETLELFGWK